MKTYRDFPKFPPPPFKKGKLVIFEEALHRVSHCNHTHTQLEGLEFAIPNWQLTPYRTTKKNSSV